MNIFYLLLKVLKKVFLPFDSIPNEPMFFIWLRKFLRLMNALVIPAFLTIWFFAGKADACFFVILFSFIYAGSLSQYSEFSKDLIEINQRKVNDEENLKNLEELKNRA